MPDIQVPDFGANWINALDAGRQRGTQMRQQNALNYAGQAYAAGDYEAAENRLLQNGMTREAGEYGALAEARRTRTNRQNVATAMQNAGPNATHVQRMQAGANAALAGGDPDAYSGMITQVNEGTRQERELAVQNLTYLAQQAQALESVPENARAQAAIQAIQGTPFDSPELRAQIERLGADGRITNEELQGLTRQALSVRDQIDLRNDERDRVEDRRRFDLNYGLQSRQVAAQERMASADYEPRLTRSDHRQILGRYNSGLDDVNGQYGNMRQVLPYANVIARGRGDPASMNMSNTEVRLQDVALLRAAARAQTGVGVLTESEVMGTLSPSLQQALRTQGAYFDEREAQNLSTQARQALADFVQRSDAWLSRRAWDFYDQALAQLPSTANAQSLGIIPPRIPHPEDRGSLNSPARNDYQVNSLYTTPAGRTYRYLGPGDFQTERVGDRYAPLGSGGAGIGSSWARMSAEQRSEAVRRLRANPSYADAFRALGADPAQYLRSGPDQ